MHLLTILTNPWETGQGWVGDPAPRTRFLAPVSPERLALSSGIYPTDVPLPGGCLLATSGRWHRFSPTALKRFQNNHILRALHHPELLETVCGLA